MKQKYELIPVCFWIGIGAYIMIGSYSLDLGSPKRPGAGLLPFLLGIFLICLAIIIGMRSLRIQGGKVEKENGDKRVLPERAKLLKVGYTVGLLFSYIILLEVFGYLLTTFLFLIFLFKVAASLDWKVCLLSSVLTALGTYGAFTLLGVNFPEGMF